VVDKNDNKTVAIDFGQNKKEAKKRASQRLWKYIRSGEFEEITSAMEASLQISEPVDIRKGTRKLNGTSGLSTRQSKVVQDIREQVSVNRSLLKAIIERKPVEGLFQGEYFPCTLKSLNAEGDAVTVIFEGYPDDPRELHLSEVQAAEDDSSGDRESWKKEDGQSQSHGHHESPLMAGERVEALWEGKWFPARVSYAGTQDGSVHRLMEVIFDGYPDLPTPMRESDVRRLHDRSQAKEFWR